MTDTITTEHRSWNMSRIRSANTKPELVVRSLLHRLGYRFSLRRKDLPGKPDIVLRRYKTVIFVHGCFWHRHAGCKQASTPKSRKEFWEEKFARNVARDAASQCELRKQGWRVLVVWECGIKADPIATVLNMVKQFDPDQKQRVSYDELPEGKDCLKVAEKKMNYALRRIESTQRPKDPKTEAPKDRRKIEKLSLETRRILAAMKRQSDELQNDCGEAGKRGS